MQKPRESASQTQLSMLETGPELEMATAMELGWVMRRRARKSTGPSTATLLRMVVIAIYFADALCAADSSLFL